MIISISSLFLFYLFIFLTVTTAYFDLTSVLALTNPLKWFAEGKPIPKRLHPPSDAIGYYSDAKNRGYLADPDEIGKKIHFLKNRTIHS